jgi:two-component system, NarL family, sensor histidine kinase UhpB
LVLAHESEQRRIARELHDQIGQDLTALKITLSRGRSGKPEDAVHALREAEGMTEDLLETVRNICGTLRPQVLDDLGLIAGLQWHMKIFSARTGLDITFDFSPIDESRLSQMVKSTVFRVIQEALTNVSRHADTGSASVMLAMRHGGVEFSIRDGGKGFQSDEALKKGSSGVAGMRERLSLVQGDFEICSSPQQGTIIRAHIPLPSAQDNQDIQNTENRTPNQPNRIRNGKKPTNQGNHSRRPSSRAERAQVPARQ